MVEEKEKRQVAMRLDLESEYNYLKDKGIGRTQFFKQAIQAHKDGTFKFDYRA